MNNPAIGSFFALLLISCLHAFAEPASKPPLYLQASAQALSEGNPDKAKKILLGARAENPNATGIDFGLAVISFSKGERKEAADLLEKSIAASQMLSDSHNLLGIVRVQQGQTSEAIKEFQAAISADPNNAQYYVNLAEAFRADYEPKRAYEPLQKAASLDTANHGFYELKLRLAKIDAGDIDEIASAIESKIKENPDKISSDWIFTASALCFRKGRMQQGATLLEQARQGMQEAIFLNLLQDHAIKFFATEPALAPFYKSESKPAS